MLFYTILSIYDLPPVVRLATIRDTHTHQSGSVETIR